MFLALGIFAAYMLGAVGAVVTMRFRPPTPEPSPVVIRIHEYLRTGRR